MSCHRAIDRAILYSAIGLSRNAADVVCTGYAYICQHHVLHLAFGISDFDGRRYALALLAGKFVMVAMMAIFGESLSNALENPLYLILAVILWVAMYFASKIFCRRHNLD